MVILRTLHISDLHFDGYHSEKSNFLEKRFCSNVPLITGTLKLSILEYWKDTIDAVLISGDLTCLAKPRDFKHAIEWVDEINKSIPVFLIPGNHDRYDFDLFALPAGIEFDNTFTHYWEKNKRIQSIRLKKDGVDVVSVILCDFTLKEKKESKYVLGHYGQGKFDDDDLKLLNSIAEEEKDLPQLCMIHFSPEIKTRPFDILKKMKNQFEILINGDLLLKGLNELGISYIFCGHTHKKDFYTTSKFREIEIHCSGTSGCIKKKHDTSIHFRDIHINNSNGEIDKIVKQDFSWKNSRERFEPA